MEMEPTINVNELQVVDSGVINCSVIIDEVEYFSEPFELQVTGKMQLCCQFMGWQVGCKVKRDTIANFQAFMSITMSYII